MDAAANKIEKIEIEIEVKCNADKYYRMFKNDVKELPKHVPHLSEHVEILEGDGVEAGSVKFWRYNLAGKEVRTCKERMKVVDDEKRMITHSFIEGDAMEYYSFFDITFTVSPKGSGHGDGSVVKWYVEYVKKNEDAPIPTSYLDHMAWVTKDLDAKIHKDA